MSQRKNFSDHLNGFPFSKEKENLLSPSPFRISPEPCTDLTLGFTWERKRRYEEAPEVRLTNSNSKRMKTNNNQNLGTGSLSIAQIKNHLLGLRDELDDGDQEVDVANSTAKKCKLCGLSSLMLTPEPKLCSGCGAVIKYNTNYHRTNVPGCSEQFIFCRKCFTHSHKSITFFNGKSIPKNTLVLTKNVENIEEPWVQCDTCGEWNHRICGLQCKLEEKHKCPKCRLREMERKGSASTGALFFCAKDLPQTELGNFIEQRLLTRLIEDRKERALASGKPFTEVPGAEDLFVRVVLSVEKKSTVGDNLSRVLPDYPKEFPYTLKMILLFEKIGGVDVCLFSMYVQEYGSECKKPNQRYCYISYIDSVKHFTPDIAASTGEALRTFAYHEVVIGYIDYMKKRGFTRCFLWSCPPLNGDQYILNCHPVSQKTPKSDRLRQWYQKMLKKAVAEQIVIKATNLYDTFLPQRQSDYKFSITHLPYFEGDYLPGVIEQLVAEVEKAPKNKKKWMNITPASLLIEKVGDNILPQKENFMVIDLQHFCDRCHEPILSGKRWLVQNSSYLCQRCHDQHHTSSKGNQNSTSELVVAVPIDTDDNDHTIKNEKCESRQTFLQFCQEHHYQFDTLRRAKHSSLMILHYICSETRSCTSPREDIVHDNACESMDLRQKIKTMFVHSTTCNVRAGGGCDKCKKVWYILYSHSKLCMKSTCTMPHCKELKKKLRLRESYLQMEC